MTKYLLYIGLFLSSNVWALPQSFEQYAVDTSLAQILDRHSDEIYYKLKQTDRDGKNMVSGPFDGCPATM